MTEVGGVGSEVQQPTSKEVSVGSPNLKTEIGEDNLSVTPAEAISNYRTALQTQASKLHSEARLKRGKFPNPFRRRLEESWSFEDKGKAVSSSSVLQLPQQRIDDKTPLDAIQVDSCRSTIATASHYRPYRPLVSNVLTQFKDGGLYIELTWQEELSLSIERVLGDSSSVMRQISRLNDSGFYSLSASHEPRFWGGGVTRKMGILLPEKDITKAEMNIQSNAQTASYEDAPCYLFNKITGNFVHVSRAGNEKRPNAPDNFSIDEFEQIAREMLKLATYTTTASLPQILLNMSELRAMPISQPLQEIRVPEGVNPSVYRYLSSRLQKMNDLRVKVPDKEYSGEANAIRTALSDFVNGKTEGAEQVVEKELKGARGLFLMGRFIEPSGDSQWEVLEIAKEALKVLKILNPEKARGWAKQLQITEHILETG